MKVSELIEKFELKVFADGDTPDREIAGAYVSDLLSDVMGNASENQVWITLQTHQNVVAIASLLDLAAVILVNGHEPDADALAHSSEQGITLLGTSLTTFEMAGRLYSSLNGSSREPNS